MYYVYGGFNGFVELDRSLARSSVTSVMSQPSAVEIEYRSRPKIPCCQRSLTTRQK